MKTTLKNSSLRRRILAYTLAEMMVSMAVYTLMFGGLLSATLFGMKQDELTNSKLGANDESRKNFNLMLDEIRSSKDVQIGSGTWSNFTALADGSLQQGSSLQIIPSTNLNVYVYYWFDTNHGTLSRAFYSNGLIATNLVGQYMTNLTSQWLTNSMVFRAMDYTGTTNLTVDPTNYNTYNYVVSVLMQFYQYQYPQTQVGTNQIYNYYQLSYSATRRSP